MMMNYFFTCRPKQFSYSYLIGVWLVFLSNLGVAAAQQRTVTGFVKDSQTQHALANVSILLKGSSVGTTSDRLGQFSVDIPEDGVLIFSSLGYRTQELAVNGSTLNISLEPEGFELDDIVIVGTRMRKSDLTGAIGTISAEQLKEVPTTDLTTAMQGKVPGLYISRSNAAPGEDITIKVRGTNSISYGTNPVYVIDGIIAEEGLRMVNPDDIASIEVLKDASSTALYGSKASNGVVVITTKKGKTGAGKVNYSGFATVSNYQRRLKTLDSRQMYDLRIDAFANAYMDENPNADRQQYIEEVLTRADRSNAIFDAEELRNGQNNITSDWLGEVVRTGLEQNHALNFSGADEESNYFLGFTYSDNAGVLVKSNYERIGGRFNYERRIKPWLKVGTNTSISRAVKDRLDGSAYEAALMGNPMQEIDTDRLYMYFQGVPQMGSYNPILSQDIDSRELHNRVLTANFVEANPIENLFIRTTLSADIYNKEDSRYVPSYVGQSMREGYNGQGSQWRGLKEYWQWDNSINYEKTIGKHRFFGLLSSMLSSTRGNSINMNGYNFPTDFLGSNNMGLASNRNLNNIGSDYRTHNLFAAIARMNYTYDDRYLLTATVRRDGSSKFGNGNKWGTFPSVSGAWNIDRESFMENASWVNQLKLRAGFGLVGNQNIPDYSFMTVYSPSYSLGSVGFVPEDSRFGNRDLRWEKQQQWNVGIDASFWNNRLSITGEVFAMSNRDLLMRMSLWPSFGYNYQIANVAKLDNKGIEFNFNALLVSTSDFQWRIAGNIAHDRNKVRQLLDGVDVLWNGGNIMSRDGNLFVGESLNTYYSFSAEKIAQQSDMGRVENMTFYNDYIVRPGDILPKDLNGDGKITPEDDMTIVGKADPRFYGGFTTNLRYKGLSLDAAFVYSYGAKKFDWKYERMMDGNATAGPAHEDQLDRWTPENTDTNIPRAYRGNRYNRFGYGSTNWGLMNASFLRLAALTLRYNFSQASINPVLENLSVFTSANNLFLITPYKGYDPESGEGFPLAKSFTFGLNVSF
ncbi:MULTISPECIES: SusC/RagA family TonB-linked outer membrane protein [Sphingobacterium]|uniref:SusC/RagA family TonB-linked outer membrane protein n=1 Tax=Sphingobacterium populi TaxID=1812824 RepID=A0ABW5UG11_9SPHI|nr:TonB-dependent receptor [Sphingobacterium sp. CFCC 11742]